MMSVNEGFSSWKLYNEENEHYASIGPESTRVRELTRRPI